MRTVRFLGIAGLFFSLTHPVTASEQRLIVSLEIKPEYILPVAGFGQLGAERITVTAKHPDRVYVSIASGETLHITTLVQDPHDGTKEVFPPLQYTEAAILSVY